MEEVKRTLRMKLLASNTLLGVGELVLITIVVIALILPEFDQRLKRKPTHRFKLYGIIAVLLFAVAILSRLIFTLMIMFAASVFVLFILSYFV